MDTTCPTCIEQPDCCSTSANGVNDDPFVYSLVNGIVLRNQQASFIFECPPGFNCFPGEYPKTITIPPGTIEFVYHPNNDGFPIRFPCGSGEIVVTIPAGSTQAQALAIVEQAMAQCVQQRAFHIVTRDRIITFDNETQSISCSGGKVFYLALGTMPTQLFIFEGRLSVKPFIFSSQASQADANQKALDFLNSYAASGLSSGKFQCGYWNVKQTFICPDLTIKTIDAFTYFSTVSQAEADANALAAAEALCAGSIDFNALSWSLVNQQSPSPPGSGTSLWSALGNNFNLFASCDPLAGDPDLCIIHIHGTMAYTGPEILCKVDLSAPSFVYNSSVYPCGTQIFVDGNLAFFGSLGPPFSPLTLQFTIPDSIAAVIDVHAFLVLAGAGPDYPVQSVNYSGTLNPV
jgi:hypothetical protein